MPLEELHILKTNDTPGILLKPEGFIRIDGRGLFGHNDDTVERILQWLHEYLKCPAKITIVIVAMEYLNSSSAKVLVSILREITKVEIRRKHYFIHWCYEEDDDDILERGEHISETLNITIDFVRTRDLENCCRSIC